MQRNEPIEARVPFRRRADPSRHKHGGSQRYIGTVGEGKQGVLKIGSAHLFQLDFFNLGDGRKVLRPTENHAKHRRLKCSHPIGPVQVQYHSRLEQEIAQVGLDSSLHRSSLFLTVQRECLPSGSDDVLMFKIGGMAAEPEVVTKLKTPGVGQFSERASDMAVYGRWRGHAVTGLAPYQEMWIPE